MDFPCHDKADTGQAGYQTCYYTSKKGESDPSIISLLKQNIKAKANRMHALLWYCPPHCYLSNDSARIKPSLIHLQVQALQRIEEIEAILYIPSQRLKSQ